MLSIQFWKSWPSVYQRLFACFAGVAVLSIIFLWYGNFTTPEPVFTPVHTNELSNIDFTHHSFRIGTFIINVPAEAYVILEHHAGGQLTPNNLASYIFLVIVTISMIGLLGVITVLTRFWFFVGLGFFMIFIVSLQLESVVLPGPYRIPSIILLILYGGVACYFQFFKSQTGLVKRILAFTALIGITALGISYLSFAPQPLLNISAHATIIGTLLTIIFICMVAHEFLAALIFVVSRGTRQTKSLRHFLIISIIYIVNLAILYAERKHLIEWGFLSINLFLFITLSGILGLWGFRQRSEQYKGIFEMDPFGMLFYLCLASVCFGTIGYFLATANDPVIVLMQDTVLYAHLGYGVIFLTFVISNFGEMLSKNLQAYKVLYKPENMPYFTFRLAGLIATFIFFAYSNWRVSFHQAFAGYYNAHGDMYFSENDIDRAEGNYKLSVYYALRNYHAHYALAQIHAAKNEGDLTQTEYQTLVDSRPIDLAYLNLSRIVSKNNDITPSMAVLKNGLHDFPNNAFIQNELGLLYAEDERRDSALIFVNAAKKSSNSAEAKTNLMGLSAKFSVHAPADSLLNLWGSDEKGVRSNALALACLQGRRLSLNVDPGKDTALDIYAITALHNFLANAQESPDSTLITKAVTLGRAQENPFTREFLISGAGYASYATGQLAHAFRLLRELAFIDHEIKYDHVLGLWALEQHAPLTAIGYFDEALKENFKDSYFGRAIALTDAENFPAALIAWDSLLRSRDVSIALKAKKMLAILKASHNEAMKFNDEEKYLYSRVKIGLDNNAEFNTLIASVSDPEFRARALVDRARKFDEADDPDRAAQTLIALQGLKLRDGSLYEEINQLSLLLLARQKNWTAMEELSRKTTFSEKHKLNKIYIEGLLALHSGEKEAVEKAFNLLAGADPFFEDAVVASVNALGTDPQHKLKMYSALAHAMDLNPNSVKLIKAYTLLSGELDFEENTRNGLDKLKQLSSPDSFLRFARENPQFFRVIPD